MINKKEGLRRKYAGAYATKWIYFISAIILFLVINYKILILVFFSLLVLLTLFAWLNWSKININYLEIAAFIFYFSSLLTFGLDEIHQSIKQILQYLKSKKQKT